MSTMSDLGARVRHVAAQVGCTRAEACAIGVLILGSGVALVLLWLLARPSAAPTTDEQAAPTDTGIEVTNPDLVVHVTGHVRAPGLQRLPSGARVADAVEAAGGVLPDADLGIVNLARPLADGEQLHVPAQGESEAAATAAGSPTAARPDGTLDLNRATAAELEGLPGIGPVLAARIVEHREANGPFTSVGDLRQVRGVGEKIFQSLADLLGV